MSDAAAAIAGTRTLVLQMDGEAALELFKAGAGFAGGAAGLSLIRWWRQRRQRQAQQPIELTARILDDGDKLRELLLEETKRLQSEREAAVERAHQAELALAESRSECRRLLSRLERKDEQSKALQTQIINLGAVPVVLTAPSGRVDGG